MKLLPKSPLDNSRLRGGTGRVRGYARKVIKRQKCSLIKSRDELEGERQTEPYASAYAKKVATPTRTILALTPTGLGVIG